MHIPKHSSLVCREWYEYTEREAQEFHQSLRIQFSVSLQTALVHNSEQSYVHGEDLFLRLATPTLYDVLIQGWSKCACLLCAMMFVIRHSCPKRPKPLRVFSMRLYADYLRSIPPELLQGEMRILDLPESGSADYRMMKLIKDSPFKPTWSENPKWHQSYGYPDRVLCCKNPSMCSELTGVECRLPSPRY